MLIRHDTVEELACLRLQHKGYDKVVMYLQSMIIKILA